MFRTADSVRVAVVTMAVAVVFLLGRLVDDRRLGGVGFKPWLSWSNEHSS